MKILIIGQAPPLKPQQLPYDSTQLYDWFEAVGISKAHAAELFIFEAMAPAFTGRNRTNSGHKKPAAKVMDDHYQSVLLPLIQKADKVLVLGAVAASYLSNKLSADVRALYLIHPSRRNIFKFRQNRVDILSDLAKFINL